MELRELIVKNILGKIEERKNWLNRQLKYHLTEEESLGLRIRIYELENMKKEISLLV